MKVNTDGMLLGALTACENPQHILDIGTGTGIIALMLAQRFSDALVEGIEIDGQTAETARENFEKSPFTSRLAIYAGHFEQYFADFPNKQSDLVVSNPPFFIQALKNTDRQKRIARHARQGFYEKLMDLVAKHLSPSGRLCMIVPANLTSLLQYMAEVNALFLTQTIHVASFEYKPAHRCILSFSKQKSIPQTSDFIIYQSQQHYSSQYKNALQDFLTIF